ncbi:helix-turn-helix transcriptional regulator [Streptomyces sp. ME19-01-6]|uniref:helix-turn-helix transcriptional regulator n=1 Tax=Streptomyces sp. ME19-01-6 TaxID=3028686 RepID=UPI0029A3E2CF|nr:helix-turn-helix transcriptional regulator [Streptomyces sp. ME19-01-6]MDX3233243.1 helix-turn-helix transcriptional regulator [Streptomyces sp. ME19-01-6]
MPEPSPERGAAGAAGSDHVERALLAAHDLIESVVTRHRQDLDRQSWVRAGPCRASAAEVADRLIAGAERTVAVVLSGDPEQEDAVCAALARPPRPGREGVAVRLLCLPGALAGPRVPALARTDARCEARAADGGLPEALLVDGRIGYVRPEPGLDPGPHPEPAPGPERARPRASLVEDAATVQALDLMFAGAWGNAVALAEPPGPAGRLCTDTARRILECLRAGVTDEVAARDLKVSLRTYRRYVAEIMRELGAHSRFQAGVRAVEAGLLPSRP